MSPSRESLPVKFAPPRVSWFLSDALSVVGGFLTTTDTDWETGLNPERRPDGTVPKEFCEGWGYEGRLYS